MKVKPRSNKPSKNHKAVQSCIKTNRLCTGRELLEALDNFKVQHKLSSYEEIDIFYEPDRGRGPWDVFNVYFTAWVEMDENERAKVQSREHTKLLKYLQKHAADVDTNLSVKELIDKYMKEKGVVSNGKPKPKSSTSKPKSS